MDVGTSFGGIVPSREMTIGALAEPALFVAIIALALVANSTTLPDMSRAMSDGVGLRVSLALALGAIVMVAIAETGRLPVDNPATHLELTMIHEVMVLDHGGPALGTVLYGAAVKLFVLSTLIVRLAVPLATGQPLLRWSVFIASMLTVAVVIGIVESIMARLRLLHVPNLLVGACLLTGFGFVLLLGSPR